MSTPDTRGVTVVLRRHADHPSTLGALYEHVLHALSAHPDDVTSVREHAQKHGLVETGLDGHRRSLRFEGTPEQLQAAFTDTPYGAIAVLGLDDRAVAAPYFRAHAPGSQASDLAGSFTPLELGTLYNFPANTDGEGQTIAILELGGGYDDANLTAYFTELGITPPKVVSIPVLGAVNQTGSEADGEVQLDIEVAGALAPKATLAVYFAPNTDQGFYEAITQAAHSVEYKPSVISISWGGPEANWTSQAIQAIQSALADAAALGITVTVAAGDNGAQDGLSSGYHADFPSSSPSVLACGGTKLVAQGESIALETVWNEDRLGDGATGGGVSQIFARPAWQANANVPVAPDRFAGRGVPDVAGVADPLTGYRVRVNGQDQVVGGTSAVAPLWAALVARLNQALKRPVGAVNADLYRLPEATFHDISRGNNDGYAAVVGWDPDTGLGSPNGQALLSALESLA